MYRRLSFEEGVKNNLCTEEYRRQHSLTGSKYFIKQSPEVETKYYSKSRYGSPRMLSKSVPRKNKNLARYRINRSLNFDNGIPKADIKFKSPNSSSDSIIYDDERHFTRSAKIMRALNTSSSPICKIERNRANKFLNFNLSPSPKRFLDLEKSPCNVVHLNLSTSSPMISKSLNFDSSPAESNISSILGTSIDSIDENQNNTPSQRKIIVKKSLKYPKSMEKLKFPLTNCSDTSPSLRSQLKEQIDNIIQLSDQKVKLTRISNKKPNYVRKMFVSTPRNLFNDFNDGDSAGSQTSNNNPRLISAKMNNINTNKKKALFSRRLGIEVSMDDGNLHDGMPKMEKQCSLVSPVQQQLQISQCNVDSITRSHKRDKSQCRLLLDRPKDGISGTVSLLNNADDEEIVKPCDGIQNSSTRLFRDKENEASVLNISENAGNKTFLTPTRLNYDSDPEPETMDHLMKLHALKKVDVAIHITSPTSPIKTETFECLQTPPISPIVIQSSDTPEMERNVAPNSQDLVGPSTPKTRVDILQRIISSSIKKSHKKLKEENKKRLPKLEISESNLSETKNHAFRTIKKDITIASDEGASSSSLERASTPENINSSRLLLPQFSSVKKSHKKDKKSKILSNFAKRQKMFNYDKEKLSKSDMHRSNLSDFENQSLRQKIEESSPNKRKLSSSSDLSDICIPLLNDDPASTKFATTDEEFKIFTPIKRSKNDSCSSLTGYEFSNVFQDNLEEISLTRCVTPVANRNIIEDELNDDSTTSQMRIEVPNVPEEPSGNSTPKQKTTPSNRSKVGLVFDVNLIKRSHKKEKKASRLFHMNQSTRLDFEEGTHLNEIDSSLMGASSFLTPDSSLHSNSLNDSSLRNISVMASKFLKSYKSDLCKPSTSYESSKDDEEMTGKGGCIQTVTPPNVLKTKSYLKNFLDESIKVSHKKKREEMRYSLIMQDGEISDDGSIFSENEKCDLGIDQDVQGRGIIGDRQYIVMNMDENFPEESSEKLRSSRYPNVYNQIKNASDDGSLFGSNEKLDEVCSYYIEAEEK